MITYINLKPIFYQQVRSAWLNSNDLNRLGPVLGVSIVYINVSIRIIAFYGYKDSKFNKSGGFEIDFCLHVPLHEIQKQKAGALKKILP